MMAGWAFDRRDDDRLIKSTKDQLARLLPKNAFARGVGVLVGGTAGAQVLTVLATPLLTRLYTPDDFGLVAVYGGLLALVGVVSSLRYELAIPLPEDDQEAAHVVALSLLIVLGTTALSTVLVLFFGTSIVKALGVPRLAGYLWLLPIGALLSGAYAVFNYWSIRTKRFSAIAETRVRQALASVAVQLMAFKAGGVALLFAAVVGQSVGTATLGKPALTRAEFKNITWRGIGRAGSRYRRFPIFSTWEGFFNTAGLQLPPLMFAGLFGPAAAGLYALANRVLSLPMSLIGSAIGQVFFSNAAEAYRADKLGPLVAQLHARLAHIGLPPTLLLIMAGPDLFGVVFGSAWRPAGEFARWMAPWLYLVFVSSPLSTLFAVMEKQIQGLMFQVILLVGRIGSILVGAWIGDLGVTIMLFAGVSALCWLGFLFWVAHLAGNRASMTIKPTLSALGIALLCATPLGIGLTLDQIDPRAWLYCLVLTSVLISARYWLLLRKAY
jgi:O-antigen/teichoic acid export membrane protein